MVPRHSIVNMSCSGRRLQPLPQYSSTFTVLHLLSQPCGITVFLCFCRDFVWIRKLIYSFKQSAPFLSVRDRLSFCVQPDGSGHFRDLSQATCNIQIAYVKAHVTGSRHVIQCIHHGKQYGLMICSSYPSKMLPCLFPCPELSRQHISAFSFHISAKPAACLNKNIYLLHVNPFSFQICIFSVALSSHPISVCAFKRNIVYRLYLYPVFGLIPS